MTSVEIFCLKKPLTLEVWNELFEEKMLVVFKMTDGTPGNKHEPELSETKQWSHEKVLDVFGQAQTTAN